MIPIFTPEADSGPVSLIEQKLGLTGEAIVVHFESVSGMREAFCFENVRDVVAKRGGEIVYGWLVWQHGELFVEAEHHVVWQKPTGELVCVTPQTPPEKALTFIPDPSATYDFDEGLLTNNIRVALVNDSRLEECFKAWEEGTEIKNSARRRCGKGSAAVELTASEALKYDELEMRKVALMSQILPWVGRVGRNEPCPCGSGKKYKKCHGF